MAGTARGKKQTVARRENAPPKGLCWNCWTTQHRPGDLGLHLWQAPVAGLRWAEVSSRDTAHSLLMNARVPSSLSTYVA